MLDAVRPLDHNPPLPQAVAWLRNKAREFLHERCWRIVHIAILERRLENLAAKRRTVHHKEYVGELPVKRQRPAPDLLIGDYYPRGRVHRPPPIEDQWYDRVEELDQTHADRRLELANELVNLPPFTAYVRTATSQHHVALFQPGETGIDEARIERIRQVSKERFGRTPESPAPSVPPVEPGRPRGEPPRQRVVRYRDEE